MKRKILRTEGVMNYEYERRVIVRKLFISNACQSELVEGEIGSKKNGFDKLSMTGIKICN